MEFDVPSLTASLRTQKNPADEGNASAFGGDATNALSSAGGGDGSSGDG